MDTDVCTELRLDDPVTVVTRGDDNAVGPGRLSDLYREHAAALARYAFRSGVADDDVEDVIADVFVIVWRKIDAVPAAPGDRPWLLGVTRNVAARHRESRWRRGRLIERLTANGAPGKETAADQVVLSDAIRRLPPKDRDVVQLVLWEGLNHEEVAAVLGCSANASRLRFHRAKARLRMIVEADEQGR